MNHPGHDFWISASTQGPGEPSTGIRRLTIGEGGQPRLGTPQPVGDNPMFLASPVDSPDLIAVAHELERGLVSLHHVVAGSEDAVLQPAGAAASTGLVAPCHLAATSAGDLLVAANYGAAQYGAGLSVHPMGDEGVGEPILIVEYPGSGPVGGRQAASHVHQVTLDEDADRAYVCDLGADAIHVHRLSDLAYGDSTYTNIQVTPGSGPRHLALDGDRVLVVGELDNTVWVFDANSGQPVAWAPTTRIPGSSASALCLSPQGLLYVGNRGPNTVGVLRWDRDSDTLVFLGEYECGGNHPRDMALTVDGQYLIVANQWSNQLAVFDAEHERGVLEMISVLETPSPACVMPITTAR